MRRFDGIDGWWPKLRWPFVLCGSASAVVVDARDGRIVATHGPTPASPVVWPAGWLPDGGYVIARPGPDPDWTRQVAICTVGVSDPPVWSAPFPVGSQVQVFGDRLVYADARESSPGLWSLDLVSGDAHRWIPLPVLTASLRIASDRIAAHCVLGPEQYQWQILDLAGQRVATLPTDHLVIPGPGQWHGSGYYGAARMVAEGQPPCEITVAARESVPVLVRVWDRDWAVTATTDETAGVSSLLVRPAAEVEVVQIDGFEAAYLDAARVHDDWIAVAGCSASGVLTVTLVDLTRVRARYRPPVPVPPPAPLPPERAPLPVDDPAEPRLAGPTDVKPYLVGDETDWPAAAEHDGVMHCFWEQWGETDGRAIFQKDVAHGRHFEVWDFTADWVRHRRDRVGDARGAYYEFSDGRWLPRWITPAMVGTTVVTAPGNRIRWASEVGVVGDWTPFPYEMRLVIATERRLVFEYDPAPGSGNYEIYECLRNRGWRRWWAVEHGTRRVLAASQWPSNADPTRRTRPNGFVPDPRVPWPPHVVTPPPPVPGPVRATIREPSFPVTGPAPLAVRCVAEVTAGVATGFVWQMRAVGDAEWWTEHLFPVPAHDTDHTFWFSSPGTYEVRLLTHGEHGATDVTGTARRVIVT